ELLDSVTIARSRRHIVKYYDTTEIGAFPERLAPISRRCELTTLPGAISYNEIYKKLSALNMSIYTPSEYILSSKAEKYEAKYGRDMENVRFKQVDRERGIMILMRINLLKRLESSVHAFRLTVERVLSLIVNTLYEIEHYEENAVLELREISGDDFDDDDQNNDLFTVGKKVKISLADMDHITWGNRLKKDFEVLTDLLSRMNAITPVEDNKLDVLKDTIKNKLANPINGTNKKIVIFSAFSDTVEYLYQHIGTMLQKDYGLHTAMVTGGANSKTTVPKLPTDLNTILTCFSPLSKDKHLIMPDEKSEIDMLIATDCISEGQNLQDCDFLINYDIHWNPVRIIQRFGRIDRIGSKNKVIQLVNFWPDLDLDEYIKLKSRVESRMRVTVMTATGDDNPIDDEKGDLAYRKQQLERLQKEVVDIEEMSSGISIMDLGLNEFRLDLLSYSKEHPSLDRTPFGLHAIVPARGTDIPPGVVYILKNINNGVNAENQNRLHPFYMVYISDGGEIVSNHLEPKKTLDILRLVCKGRTQPEGELCRRFNQVTDDGKNMGKYSDLLGEAIGSVIHVKEQKDIDSFFSEGETSFLTNAITGLDDFELICFIVIQ
ncbi:MAG: ATP-dependent helicase, partial [Clostridiales bacterium]|nr:ATP-dependent helicase [Clostridiales bacterium]